MKIFGIGLNKTGTTSLGKALEILGYNNHITCDWELTKSYFDGNTDQIFSVADKHNNFEDWPWPLLYKELYKKYPESKFILTTRKSSTAWYKSLCKHSIRTGPTEFRKLIYGHYMPQDFPNEHIDIYESHNQNVSNFFNKEAPSQLIKVCWENGDGWNEICDFLNKDIPNFTFPFLNKSKTWSLSTLYQISKQILKQKSGNRITKK